MPAVTSGRLLQHKKQQPYWLTTDIQYLGSYCTDSTSGLFQSPEQNGNHLRGKEQPCCWRERNVKRYHCSQIRMPLPYLLFVKVKTDRFEHRNVHTKRVTVFLWDHRSETQGLSDLLLNVICHTHTHTSFLIFIDLCCYSQNVCREKDDFSYQH